LALIVLRASSSVAVAQDSRALQKLFPEAASTAIGSEKGAVLVVEVLSSGPRRSKKSTFYEHWISVEEVIKGFYDPDEGYYYTPLMLGEDTRRGVAGVPFLGPGKRFVVAINYLGFPFACGEVNGATELSGAAGDAELVNRLRQDAAARAVFGHWGSAHGLRGLDSLGVRSGRADGSVDPDAFGQTQAQTTRDLNEGASIVVARYRGLPGFFDGDRSSHEFEVLEHLGGAAMPRSRFTVSYFDEERALIKLAKTMPKPYRPSHLWTGHFCLLVISHLESGITIKRRVPLIGKNDQCVRTIRAWCQSVEGRRSRPETRSEKPESRPR
jgi:hypothetical protein